MTDAGFPRLWVHLSAHQDEPQPLWVRQIGDGMEAVLDAYVFEKKWGICHESWLAYCVRTADWLTGKQNGDGSFYRSYQDDGSCCMDSKASTPCVVRFLIQLYLVTKDDAYLHAAIRAGLTHASFGVCTWLGSDLQEPLELLPASWEKIRNGCDVVYVEKKTIQVSRANRAFSRIYSWLVRKYAVPAYSSGGISTIVFNQKIRDYLNENIESNSIASFFL